VELAARVRARIGRKNAPRFERLVALRRFLRTAAPSALASRLSSTRFCLLPFTSIPLARKVLRSHGTWPFPEPPAPNRIWIGIRLVVQELDGDGASVRPLDARSLPWNVLASGLLTLTPRVDAFLHRTLLRSRSVRAT